MAVECEKSIKRILTTYIFRMTDTGESVLAPKD